MLSQRDAVVQTTLEVLQKNGVTFTPGLTDVKVVSSDDIRLSVISKVVELTKTGQVSFKSTPSNQAKLSNDSKLTSYVSSLVANHWKRDPQLNGGINFRTKK